MDWVQVYFIVLQFIAFGVVCNKHGQPREDNWSIYNYLFGVLICAPYWGRVLGWW